MSNPSNIYLIKPGEPPLDLRLNLYRGSSDSISFIALENDGVTPFNLGFYTSFRFQFRIGSPLNKNILTELTEEDLILGQSQAAIDYEIDNELAAGSIKDELHCLFRSDLFKDVMVKRLLSDIEAIRGDEAITIAIATVKLTFDVSREL